MPLLFLVTFANNGFSQEIINYFEVASNIAKPVTMKTGKGTYTIWGGERIDGNLGWIEAYDANGNKIVNNTPYKTEIGTNKPTIRRYRFQTLYKSTPSNTSNQSNSGSWGKDVGRKLSDVADQGFGIPQEGYPNLQIRAGFSFLPSVPPAFCPRKGGSPYPWECGRPTYAAERSAPSLPGPPSRCGWSPART